MPDIHHQLTIQAPIAKVFAAVSTPDGLASWWTMRSSGSSETGDTLQLYFDPEHDWKAEVVSSEPPQVLELQMTEAMDDWLGTRILFELSSVDGQATTLKFAHLGWEELTDHFRISSYCWANHLRCLARYLELGEVVPYAER